MQHYDNAAAYRAVIAKIRAKVPDRSPQTWLGEQLGVSRQIVYMWEAHGFPERHAETIAALLDMDPAQVCPSLVTCYLPEPIFNAIIHAASAKKPFHVKLVELIKLGLQRGG